MWFFPEPLHFFFFPVSGWCLSACLTMYNVLSLLRKKDDISCQHLCDLPLAGSLLSLAKGNFEENHPGFSRSMGHSIDIINLSLSPHYGVWS